MKKLIITCLLALSLAGCSMSNNEVLGTTAGAVVGGVAGNALGGGTAGTVAGAAVGGLVGYQLSQ